MLLGIDLEVVKKDLRSCWSNTRRKGEEKATRGEPARSGGERDIPSVPEEVLGQKGSRVGS